MIKKVPRKNQYQDSIGLNYLKNSSQLDAFLTNFKTSSYYQDDEEQTAILCYFEDQYGEKFKAWYLYQPYFYVGFEENAQTDVRAYIETRVPKVDKIQLVHKIDLDDRMHLLGNQKPYLKVSFKTVSALTNARNPLKGQIDRRKKKAKAQENYYLALTQKQTEVKDIFDLITDIRQFDVPFHSRVCIDTGLRAGKWFSLQIKDKVITKLTIAESKQSMPELKVLAYDIQTSKAPLKFPDAETDEVIMISFAYEGNGYLIVNGGFCGQKVQEFYYQPKSKKEYGCDVIVFNQQSEKATLLRFAQCLKNYNPTIITTFNGDKFDYPFIFNRCAKNYINFEKEFGVKDQAGQYYGNFLNHMDCYYWVVRDAYLPHGSHGLKAVTKAKLQYQPQQIDPQLMVGAAKNNTAKLAHYAVSDAIATYYLYMKHIHGFIFALSTIIPMTPDQVLRKGSGTLCENLLMVEAFNRNIIFPNKYSEKLEKFHKGHLLDSQTYTGGRVQCLRTGVYRADFKTDFCLQPQAFQQLIDTIDDLVKFAVTHQAEQSFENIQNFQQIKQKLIVSLSNLRDVKTPKCHETYPLIYHLDVAAMYPNIILTNRLQPVAVVDQNICSNCVYNSPQNDCKRDLQWQWKGQIFPLKEGEYMKLKQGHQSDRDLSIPDAQFEKQLKTEVRKYCQKVYKKVHISESEIRTNTVCMRENSFYVDTVRAFRDRRYEFKKQVKVQKGHVNKFKDQKDYAKMKQSQVLMELYESMQLAHKIILNSFYGYVMRKGSRWYSMETAAMVTYIGSNIISDSKKFIENRIGKPLQLDTDGIWLMLPQGFPQNLKIKFKNGKTFNLSYPCHILNRLIYQKYANNQYQDLNAKNKYEKRKQMTIFFEIDGPYKAMMIPSAKQKQKNQLDIQQQGAQMLKKRYAVFNFKNQISQFKGFQMKRRGQLQITKIFQEKIFDQYVKGENLEDCYKHCATTAQKYIDIITKKAMDMCTEQIISYFEESRVLSRDIKDYGASKGLAITTASRLIEFLGPEVIKGGKNLCCKFVISAHPRQSPVTDRAIPTLIFQEEEPQIQKKYLYKWTKQQNILQKEIIDIRDILDWDYYYERLSTQVLKMICIPAVLQGVSNPIPDIQLPEWLKKKTFDMRRHKQSAITGFNLIPRQKQLQQQGKIQNIVPTEIKQEIKMQRRTKNPYSIKKNFKSWLQEQKKIWKNKKRQVNVNYGNYRHSDLKSVLQIIPDKILGNFTVWYWAGGRIQQMLVNMKRRYFMKDLHGLKHAPRDEGQAIQVVIDQPVFARQQDCYDSLMGRSFYETKLPLLTTLIMNKGNLWKADKSLSIYNESDLHEIFGQEYLPGLQRDFLPSIYIVRLEVLQHRTVWAVIKPKFDQYYFIFVDKAIGSSSQQLLKFTRKIINNNEAKIQISHKNHEKEAAEHVNELLKQYEKQIKNPYMVLLQSDQSIQYLQKIGVTTLYEDMPVLSLGDVPREKIQILEWKSKIIKAILKESSHTGQKVSKLLSWSRFSHVPICNLSQEKEQLDYITNLYYSRLLHSGDHLTWWNQYNRELHIGYQSTQYTGKIINSGLYSSHCFIIQMENFAVNAIANAQQLTNLDPQTAAMIKTNKKNVQQKSIEHVDEIMRVRTAFEYLRKMVKGWIKDIKNHSQEANILVTNLHKWITTQSNSMYDPLLTKMVNDFMKKVFYRLLGKLSNLGLQIVSANFSRMTLATGKHTLQEAKSKIHYCLNKCTQQDQKLFPYIIFSPNEAYRSLIYRDQHNYQGIIDSNLRFEFDMCNLLCKEVSNHLQFLLIYFLENLNKISESLVQKYGENAIQLHQNYEREFVSELKTFIIGSFNEKVVKLVKQLWNIWRTKRQEYKFIIRGQYQTQQEEQESVSADQEEENDSFVVDSIEQSQNKDLKNKLQKMDIQDNKLANKHNPRKKKKERFSQEYLNDLEKWSKDHQIDLLIQNLYATLCYNDTYKDQFQFVRKEALSSISLKPCLIYRSFNPVYPRFELPCKVCCSVNQNPGQCQHCGNPGSSNLQLQRTVWKMMQQQQNKDLYCSWCKRIKQQYLKKCGCGGSWVFKQNPMGWLPYQPRISEEWEFVNKVLQFMGLDNEEPLYQVTSHKPQTYANDL